MMKEDSDPRIHGTAKWTYDPEATAWSISLDERIPPPYLHQITVSAILDLDSNGHVAKIEIIDTPNGKELRPPTVQAIRPKEIGNTTWAVVQLILGKKLIAVAEDIKSKGYLALDKHVGNKGRVTTGRVFFMDANGHNWVGSLGEFLITYRGYEWQHYKE